MLPRLFALEQFGIKLGLANITRLCEALGHPERSFSSLHIAGTNGKGSVTAMTHGALVAAGIRAGRYTSPHLARLNERFVVGDAPVSDADLEAAATTVLDLADDLVRTGALAAPPTFFEATTATAFELFRRARIDVAVLEVGRGGRFDATNVVAPVACAITSIGLDHQEQLGTTVESVAVEKAGIVKPGVPVVIGRLPAEAEAVVRRAAAECAAPVVSTRDVTASIAGVEDGRTTLALRTPDHDYGRLEVGLRGEHQADNAVVAVRLLETARQRGIDVDFNAIARGVHGAQWPARLERIQLDGHRAVLIDAAHNPDGAAALARYLHRWHPNRPPLVFAAMRDKDIDAVLRVLLPTCGAVIVTAPATPRAEDPDALAARVRAIDPARDVQVVRDPLAAVDRALAEAPLACVAGSIFLAGAVRDALHGRAILP
jgi:dihydrofolate synthase / folylpolyglutamate synthase